MEDNPDNIVDLAGMVISASRSLDYGRIRDHDPEAVARLQEVLVQLRIHSAGASDSLTDYASPQTGPSGDDGEDATAQRRETLVNSLSAEGFAERIDHAYNSFSKDRMTPIDRVPHHRGLPPYDLVLAPDFAPLSGLHGIFITANKVMSLVLPSDIQPSGDWQLLREKSFSTAEEMVEIVTLVAAGFDLS